MAEWAPIDMKKKSPLTVEDATHLMAVLDKDIPECDKKQVALLLLILAANPELAEKGDVVGYSPRTSGTVCTGFGDYGDGDFYGYGC